MITAYASQEMLTPNPTCWELNRSRWITIWTDNVCIIFFVMYIKMFNILLHKILVYNANVHKKHTNQNKLTIKWVKYNKVNIKVLTLNYV